MTELAIDKLLKDPDYKKGKSLLLQSLKKQTEHLNKVRPAQKSKKVVYEKALKELGKKRGSATFYPYIGSGLGNGPFVELGDGSVKYDMICGIGAHFGHNHPVVVDACIDAALTNTVMQGHLQQNADSLKLMKTLCRLSKKDHCFLSTSGAMACENALKIAFHNKHPAQRIFAFSQCFMGRTTTLSQITDKPQYRQGLPRNLHVTHLPFYDPKKPKDTQALDMIRENLARHPGEYAACVFELVQGEAGFKCAPPHFFIPLMEELKAAGVLNIIDEVQTFARTGEAFAYQLLGLESYVDIVTIGKLAQVCATLYNKKFQPGPGLLSQTYTASTTCIRSCQAILDFMQKEKYFGPQGKVNRLHKAFVKEFKRLSKAHPKSIEGPFGIGGMCTFTAFGGDVNLTKKLLHKLFDMGVICFIAGVSPIRIRFLLPLGSISEQDIRAVSDLVEKAIIFCSKK